MSTLNSDVEADLDLRIIQNFMDVIVLKLLKKNRALCGYDVIKHFHKKFGMLPSSGTVYSLLYSLERNGLVQGESNGRKRTYALTKHGEDFLKGVGLAKQRNHAIWSSVLSEI